MHDVIVVGAGPAGLRLAKRLDKDLDVVVVERNARIRAKVCSGLISSNLEKFIPIDNSWVEHAVKGAYIHLPYGELELKKPGTAAYVVNRGRFDRTLAGGIRNIRFGTRVLGLEVESDRVKVKTSRGLMECQILVGCDGAHSVVRRHFRERPKEMLNGLIAYTRERNSADHVELWFNRRLLPDGFFWKIPRGTRTEYGMWGSRAAFRDLKAFFRLGKCRVVAASIPLGLIRTAFDRTILLGDAACQVKPWSGGGIIWSFTAADMAAGKILESLERGDMGILKGYDRAWKARIRKQLKRGMIMRRLYRNVPDMIMKLVLNWYNRSGRLNALDMDFL